MKAEMVGKHSLDWGKAVQQREWASHQLWPWELFPFREEIEQGFARGMLREEPGSSFPTRRQSKTALAGETLMYNKGIIEGFLQEGKADSGFPLGNKPLHSADELSGSGSM